MGADTPCKDCQSRTSNCHSICDDYIEWRQEHNKVRDAIKEKRANDRVWAQFRHDNIQKQKRAHRGS